MAVLKQPKQIIILLIAGTLAIAALFTSYIVREMARCNLCFFYNKAMPTLRSIEMCGNLLQYRPIQEYSNQEDFYIHLEKTLPGFNAEFGIPPQESIGDNITKDAWEKKLYFSIDSNNYRIASAGKDGQIGTKDDISNSDNWKTLYMPCRLTKAASSLLFLASAILFSFAGFRLLKQNSPAKNGAKIFGISFMLAIIYFVFLSRIKFPYEIYHSLTETFAETALFAGFLLSGILLSHSSKLNVKYIGYLLVGIPLILWLLCFCLLG
ncbi:MAG: hypothetical protein WCW64_00980 [Phycisphaerae bacterium]|jgi:hypothetical protein